MVVRRRWLAVMLVFAVVATVANGVVVGYGVLWFQLFGDRPDAEDYAVSAGGYGAAALVLALGVPALRRHAAPRWVSWGAAGSAAVLGTLAVGSVVTGTTAERSRVATETAWTGIGGVLWAPWTWLLVVLGVRALWRSVRGATGGRADAGPTAAASRRRGSGSAR